LKKSTSSTKISGKELSENGSKQDRPGGKQIERERRHGSSIEGIEMKFILEKIKRM
jgi:hypothetical protein